MNLIIEIIGLTGLIIMVSAFYLNNFRKKKIKRRTKTYNAMNLLGAILLTIYSFLNELHLFTILNLIWAIFAFWFLITIITQEHKLLHEMLK